MNPTCLTFMRAHRNIATFYRKYHPLANDAVKTALLRLERHLLAMLPAASRSVPPDSEISSYFAELERSIPVIENGGKKIFFIKNFVQFKKNWLLLHQSLKILGERLVKLQAGQINLCAGLYWGEVEKTLGILQDECKKIEKNFIQFSQADSLPEDRGAGSTPWPG